ncbi:MAG: histidine kinase [Chitinophagaceae bacterium]|nr:histidine kinase [Chitinophagaceae bacterium]
MAGCLVRYLIRATQRWLLVVMLMPALAAPAQLPYQLPDGAAGLKVNCFAQQPDRRLLVGTSHGLYLFNGVSFALLPADTALRSDAVTAIEQGVPSPWVGLASGRIAQLRQGRLQVLGFEEGQFARPVTDIVSDAQGRKWCATAGEGIYCYQQNRWFHIGTDDGLSDDYVYDLQPMGNVLAAGTDGGVNFVQFKVGRKQITHVGMRQGLADNISLSMSLLAPGMLVVGHQEKGLSVLRWQEGGSATLLYTSPVWPYGSVQQLQANADAVYAATADSGLVSCSWTANTMAPATVHGGVTQRLLLDADQRLWTSHATELNYWLHPQLALWQGAAPHTNDATYAIHASADGYWWHSRHNEVTATAWANPTVSTTYKLPLPGQSVAITCLHRDAAGVLWVGTMGHGIWLIHTASGTVRPLQLDGLSATANVLSIAGRQHQLWLSSLEGLAEIEWRSDANKPWWQQYTMAPAPAIPGIGTNYVYQVFVDSKNRLWFGTDGKGVTMLSHGQTRQYNTGNGLTGNVVYSFAEDKHGRVWMNVLNGGLCYIDKRGTAYTMGVAQGLSTNNVATVLATGNGNVVAISAQAADIIDATTLAVENWDTGQLGATLSTDLHSSAAGPATVLLASSRGILQLGVPAAVKPPAAFISSIELFMQPVDSARHVFAADEHLIGFHFDAVSYLHAADLQFQYKLEGLGAQWNSTRDRYINFPKLPSGSYRFLVRASVNDSFDQSPIYSFQFTIARPWWQQWWFIVLATLLLAGSIWWAIRLREAQLRRLQAVQQAHLMSQLETLRNQVGPHFFFNSLNTLMALIEEDRDAALRYTSHLSDFFRKLVQLRDDHTIALAQELALVNDYLYLQRQRFGEALQLNNQIPAAQSDLLRIAPLTLQLLVENAIKHNAFTSQQPLHIVLQLHDGWLTVRNNRLPKLDQPPGEGMGLQHISRRYQLLTGKQAQIVQTDQFFEVSIPLPAQ